MGRDESGKTGIRGSRSWVWAFALAFAIAWVDVLANLVSNVDFSLLPRNWAHDNKAFVVAANALVLFVAALLAVVLNRRTVMIHDERVAYRGGGAAASRAPARIADLPSDACVVFLSCAREDGESRSRFETMLRPLAGRRGVHVWSDEHLASGSAAQDKHELPWVSRRL